MFFKRKRETNRFYNEEIARHREKLVELDIGSQEYKDTQAQLKTLIALRGDEAESTRKISKADKGSILKTVLGIGGTIAVGYGVSKFEADGHIFTGQKKNLVSTLINMVKNFGIFGKG